MINATFSAVSYTHLDVYKRQIQSVVVGQNEQVPTGEIRVTMKDSKKHSFYAPDVNVVIEKLDDAQMCIRDRLKR